MNPIWKPAVTVAAVIEKDGQFLLVEERTPDGLVLNQPAGHLEPGESLLQAVVRETLEETAHDFTPSALIGSYLIRKLSGPQDDSPCYLRFAFCGELGEAHTRALDEGIVRTLWLDREQIAAQAARLRSPLVLRCVDDYLAGQRAPLNLLYCDPSITEGVKV